MIHTLEAVAGQVRHRAGGVGKDNTDISAV